MGTPSDGWLKPDDSRLLNGSERFTTEGGADAGIAVSDFWGWAFSDLRGNALRGVLAEFIVGTALGATRTPRREWDNYDLLTPEPDRLRVQVKASGYLQAWPQAAKSQLIFSGLAARKWDENTHSYSDEPELRADVFIFCVQNCQEHEKYKMLHLDQWDFYVVDAGDVPKGRKSVGIRWVCEKGEKVGFFGLKDAVGRLRLRSDVRS